MSRITGAILSKGLTLIIIWIGGILRDEMVNLLSSIKRLAEFGYLMKNSWQQDIEETQYGQG